MTTQGNRNGRGRSTRGNGRSGRNQGGAQRGNRNSSRSNTQRSNKSTTPKKKERLADYKFHVGTVAQGSDFQENARYVINHIRKEYDEGNDIAIALEMRRDYDFESEVPRPVRSNHPDEAIRRAENEAHLNLYTAEIKAFVDRKNNYRANKPKAYALLFEQCGTNLQHKIVTRSDFETVIRNNPIWMTREDVASPTVATESILLTAVIEAEEGRDVATVDIPNAFIQTEVQKKDKDDARTIMKIRGPLVEILCEMDPVYRPFVVYQNGKAVLYVHMHEAL